MNKNLYAYTELSSATVIAGSSVVVGKIITNTLPVFLSQWFCLAAAIIVLLLSCFITTGRMPRVNLRDIPYLFLQALFGMFLFRVFLFQGLKYTSAIDSGIITSSTPAVVCILAALFLKESLSAKKIFGIICTVSGIAVINMVGSNQSTDKAVSSLLGMLLVLSAVVCEALLTIFRKTASSDVSPLTGTFFVTLFSFLLFTPNAISESLRYDVLRISFNQWMIILYYGIVVTALAYILWFRGVSRVPASTAAAYTGCIPVSTLLLSVLLLKERIMLSHIAGIALTLFGIVFISVFGEKEHTIKEGAGCALPEVITSTTTDS